MATVYHRDDAGVPTYSMGSVLPTNPMHFEAVKTILKACLVNGYGSKSSAGWSLVVEDTTYIVLRNGSQSGYVCITWSSGGSGYLTLYVAETYAGMVNGVMTGDGLKTGVAANNATPQRITLGPFVYSSSVHTWYMVADAKSFVLNLVTQQSPSSTEVTGASQPGGSSVTLYVGEDSLGNFLAVGGENTTGTSPVSYFGNSGGTSLKDPRTGLLVSSGSIPAVLVPGTLVGESLAVVFPLTDIALCRPCWGFSGVVCGYLRGVATVPDLIGVYPSGAAQALGYSGALLGRNANTPLNLGDGYTYFVGVSDYRSGTRFLTNNPEFW